MKSQNNQRRQSSLLAAVTAVFLLGAFSSISAQNMLRNNCFAFDYLTSNANQNLLLVDNKDANLIQDDEYPKPDTTEMEKWYEVVKYEYDILNRKLYFVIKPKKETRPSGWLINFYDADGVQVIDENFMVGMSIYTPVGQAEKAFAYTPFESQMKKVKKVVVTRHVN